MIVYIYTFPNGKKYIGQTVQTLDNRARKGEGYRGSPKVYAAIKKYGWENIQKEIFECKNAEEMDALERQLILYYKTQNSDFGYNIEEGGHKGKHLSEETKRKISNSEKGKQISEETKNKLKVSRQGKTPFLGHHHSESTKQKIREKNSGQNNPFYGCSHTEEEKQKMRKAKADVSRPVKCLETGIIYPSIHEAARQTGLSGHSGIMNVCNKKPHYNTAGGFHWQWA